NNDKAHQGRGAALGILLVLVAAARHSGRPRDGTSAASSLIATISLVTPVDAAVTAAPPPTRQRVSRTAGRLPGNFLRKPLRLDPSSGAAAGALVFPSFHQCRAFRKRRNGR